MSEEESRSEKQPQPPKQREDSAEAGDLEAIAPELANLPPEAKRVVQASLLSMQRISSPWVSPLLDKITETHISKIIELAEKEDDRIFSDTQQARKYRLVNTI
jgi:hypothetical protein